MDIKHLGLAPGQCAVGLAVLKRIHECGLEIADIERWLEILQMAGSEDKAKAFVASVYHIQNFMHESGLSLDQIDGKIQELETKAAELQPTLNKVDGKNIEIAELEKRRDDLVPVVDSLAQKYDVLNPIVNDLQKQQSDLVKQIKEEEEITASTLAALATWAKEKQRLLKAGFTLEALEEFNDRARVIAARHHIPISCLRERLLHELEILNKGLELETKLKATRAELKTERKAITSARRERAELESGNETLREHKAALEGDIKSTRDSVIEEIGEIVPAAKAMLNRFSGELQRGDDEALEALQHLQDQALEIGRQMGRYDGIIEVNQWLVQLQSLAKGEEGLEAMKVRAIPLLVLRGAQLWAKRNLTKVGVASTLPNAVELLVMELEGWRV